MFYTRWYERDAGKSLNNALYSKMKRGRNRLYAEEKKRSRFSEEDDASEKNSVLN